MNVLTLYYADSEAMRWRARWLAVAAVAHSGMQRMQRLWYAADAADCRALDAELELRIRQVLIREYDGAVPDAQESVNNVIYNITDVYSIYSVIFEKSQSTVNSSLWSLW